MAQERPATLDEAREWWMPALERRLMLAVQGETLLAEMMRYHLATGGKRLRALLPPWICDELGGDAQDALDLGVGLELLHNATLVHDDLQDGDTVRRGQATVWRRWGSAQAINAGDALYFLGLERLLAIPRFASTATFASQALVRVIGGQVMEFQLQERVPGGASEGLLAGWRQMAAGKTGALFAACFHAGAIAAGRGADEALDVAGYGERIGLLFQVQDDLLDLVGEKGRDRRGSDLAEGKLSFPVVWALEHAEQGPASRLRRIVEAPREATTDAMISEGLSLLESTGALATTAELLLETAAGLADGPVSLPGLVARILAPVAHALPTGLPPA